MLGEVLGDMGQRLREPHQIDWRLAGMLRLLLRLFRARERRHERAGEQARGQLDERPVRAHDQWALLFNVSTIPAPVLLVFASVAPSAMIRANMRPMQSCTCSATSIFFVAVDRSNTP